MSCPSAKQFRLAKCIKGPADILTLVRAVCGILMLFFPARSAVFIVLYLTGGITDMIDGTVARRTHTASEAGSVLDTGADAVFVAACLIKILPVLKLPGYVYFWAAGIAVLKAGFAIYGRARTGRFVSVHSVWNKAAGLMLFLIPILMPLAERIPFPAIVCAVATAAAIQEGFTVYRMAGCAEADDRKGL